MERVDGQRNEEREVAERPDAGHIDQSSIIDDKMPI